MVRPGDTVRYLSEVGGGIVTRVDGKIAYVDDEGFERPVAVNELVVVLPVGHKNPTGAKLMFDQQAFDTGKSSRRNKPEISPVIGTQPKQTAAAATPEPEPEDDFPIEETEYGDALNVLLVFEPADVRKLDTTTFNIALVNDSNYFLAYQLLTAAPQRGEWLPFAAGEVAPNEIADLKKLSRENLKTLERIVFQAIAYKKDKPFSVKEPLHALRKIDQTKFFKYHCFNPGLYFDSPVLEVPLLAEPLQKPVHKHNNIKK